MGNYNARVEKNLWRIFLFFNWFYIISEQNPSTTKSLMRRKRATALRHSDCHDDNLKCQRCSYICETGTENWLSFRLVSFHGLDNSKSSYYCWIFFCQALDVILHVTCWMLGMFVIESSLHWIKTIHLLGIFVYWKAIVLFFFFPQFLKIHVFQGHTWLNHADFLHQNLFNMF